MLSDEEREAIEKIKRFNQYNWEMNNLKGKEFAKPYFESLDTLLNLIEKQSKEIEELKENNKLLEENYSSAHEDINWFCENYISKEESKQKERKAYIKGTNDAHELCNKKWEDKIKARIKEVQQRKENDGECELALHGFQREAKIEVLQSLLEKE